MQCIINTGQADPHSVETEVAKLGEARSRAWDCGKAKALFDRGYCQLRIRTGRIKTVDGATERWMDGLNSLISHLVLSYGG
jgi:hypothetical protein